MEPEVVRLECLRIALAQMEKRSAVDADYASLEEMVSRYVAIVLGKDAAG